MPLRNLPNHLNLGLRPWGLYELVEKSSGKASFVELDPGGTEIDLLVNPKDLPFSSRPRSFLTALRDERLRILEKSRSAKRASSSPKSKDGSSATTRKPRKPRTPTSVTSTLARLGTSTPEAKLAQQLWDLLNK